MREIIAALVFGLDDMALAAVAEAAKAAGKIAGGVFTTPESLQKAVGLGYRLRAYPNNYTEPRSYSDRLL